MSTRSAEQIATRQMADPHLSGINEGDPVGDTVPPWPLARPDQEFQPPVGRCEGSGQLPAADLMLAWWLPVQDRADGVTKGLACAGSTATSATPFGPNSPRHGQSRWAASLRDRAQPASGSTVSILDALADGAKARRRPASPWGLELRFPHAREQIHEKLVGTTGFEPVTPRL